MRKLLLIIFIFPVIVGSNYPDASSLQETMTMPFKVTGSGRPLVLVPGGLTGWVSWDSFVPEFSATRKVIQVQLLNVQYGLESRLLPELYSVRMESAALGSALSGAEVNGKADFVGWSYGAMVLLDYALGNPEKVRTLTLIEPPAIWTVRGEAKEDTTLVKEINTLASFPGKDEIISEDDLEKFLMFAGFARPGESVRDLPQWKAWLPFRQSLRSNHSVLNHEDFLERLRKFDVPVLLVKGTGSAYFLHRIVDQCEKDFPDSRLVEFPGGHAPHLVSRDRFLEALKEFQR